MRNFEIDDICKGMMANSKHVALICKCTYDSSGVVLGHGAWIPVPIVHIHVYAYIDILCICFMMFLCVDTFEC